MLAMNLETVDSTTIIAAILGLFFLVIAMFKNFGRKNNSNLYIPGLQKSEDEEVKLADPFSGAKAAAVKVEASVVAPPTSEKSSFKQFAPDASSMAEIKIRDDADYQWE